MQTQELPLNYRHLSPAGAEVRPLMGHSLGGIAHCTLKQGRISKAVTHKTVSEFWYVLSGSGAIWRKTDEKELITPLSTGVTIDIPLGTKFQYRADQNTDLVFICVTMPDWSGPDEARYVDEKAWEPNT